MAAWKGRSIDRCFHVSVYCERVSEVISLVLGEWVDIRVFSAFFFFVFFFGSFGNR